MINFRSILLATSFILLPVAVEAQVMRSQVYQPFMKAQILQKRGQDSAAIAALNEVAELVPNFPLTYLRQGDIYYEMYQRDGNKDALSGAVFMYRKYLTLEFNEKHIKEPSERLRKLEDILQVSHFEDDEMKDSQAEMANDKIQVITDMASAQALTPAATAAPVAAVELVSLVAEPEPAVVESASTTVAKSSFAPSLGKPKFSFLSFYEATLPQAPVTNATSVASLNAQNLTGVWVSEIMNNDGREKWIFNIRADVSHDCKIQFSKHSGVVNDDVDQSTTFRRAMAITKTYLQKTSIMSDTDYDVVNELASSKYDDKGFSFSFEVEKTYKAGNAVFNWGKNMVNNLSGMLPFGATINNFVNNFVTQKETKDRMKNANITYTFKCTNKADGILLVDVSSTVASLDENGRLKTKIGPSYTTQLFKMEQGYTFGHIDPNYGSEKYGKFEPLFKKVKSDAALDINYNYPLAMLYYYGVGTDADEAKAVECMNALAMNDGDARAKAWLSSYFYTKAYTDDWKNTMLRRKYMKSAQFWSDKMHQLKQKEWYGVKGDMCSSDQSRDIFNTMQDSAFYFYKLGDEAGDIYSTYRLGYMYMHSEKPNLANAQTMLLKAANKGNADAVMELAKLALSQKDYEGYLKNLTLAADMGCPEAYEELSRAYTAGPSHGFKLDPKEGIQVKRLAAWAEKDNWIPILLSYGYDITPYLN